MFAPNFTAPLIAETAADMTDDAVFTIIARLPGGASHTLQAPAGWRLMEVLRDYGLPIRAECGGACACATCHVCITGTGTGRVPLCGPEDDELDRLAEIFDADDSSRLACQILTGLQTDGLVVTLASDSLLAGTLPVDVGGNPRPAETR